MSFPYVTDLLNALCGTHWALPVPTFGAMVAIALVVATRVTRSETMRLEACGKLPASTHLLVGDLALVCAIAGLVGARVLHIADQPTAFMADPLAMIASRAGFSIYGGLCFGVAAGVLYLRRRGIPVLPMLDAAGPASMLGYAIGRLGCQLAGDGDWGIAADMALKPEWLPSWLWAQTYDGNIVGAVIAEPGVYPTPIYESAAAFALFAVLWSLRRAAQRPGFLFAVYLLLAGFERLLVEKIRVNLEHAWLGMQVTQAEMISLLLVAVGLLGALLTLTARTVWPRIVLALGVVTALSACVPL